VCIEHEGFARMKAERWWNARSKVPCPVFAAEAADLACRGALAGANTITTKKEGRWYRILSAELGEIPETLLEPSEIDEIPF